MKIDKPSQDHIRQLPELWKTVFGNHGGFWEMFLDTAFVPEHCRCITEKGQVIAALYWFDCECSGQRAAYVYAVVTHPEHRGKGLCRKLLGDLHAHLAGLGYSSVLLVPEKTPLRQMYEKLGYRNCTTVSEFSCDAGDVSVSVRAIGAEEYGNLRRSFLPAGGLIQEEENLRFLAAQAEFFAGEGFLLAAYREEDSLHCLELLGNRDAAPGILRALNCTKGYFRTPGDEKPFAMFHPLTGDAVVPQYFGFAFD